MNYPYILYMGIKRIKKFFSGKAKNKQMLNLSSPQILASLPNPIKDPNKIRELRNKLAKVEAGKLNLKNYLHNN